ncbi:hypothetical protein J2T18_002757 [Paenibacillus polymyxa]|nr:hypothetical protein [Paenibacillus polymyxa]
MLFYAGTTRYVYVKRVMLLLESIQAEFKKERIAGKLNVK